MKSNPLEYCENWLFRLDARLKRIEVDKEILEEERRHLFIERDTVEGLIDELKRSEVSNE